MNMKEQEFDALLKTIDDIREEDPLKAIFVIDENLKQFLSKEMNNTLNALRDDITYQIKKNNLITKTNLNTLDLISSLKNKKMDYIFMLNYNELKKRNNLQENASEFQYFFNNQSFEDAYFQTLIYDLLVLKNVDFDFKIKEKIINPKKLGSFLKNKDLKKMQDEIFNIYEKDVAKTHIARQVFSAYLFLNWIEILFNETKNDYNQIINVINVLLGDKDSNTLNKEELELYKIFK
ncbi:hypothetical protein [Metamycoplasma buccale]|uniref:hypothetical protein n=1 Tax=Metamycoplasma buccale TaxID=55602 RepID=UPI00398F8E07